MRKRWRFTWRIDGETVYIFWSIWLFGGFLASAVLSLATDNGGVDNAPTIAAMSAWGFGCLVVPILWLAIRGIAWIYHNPPFERITESVEDIREHYDNKKGAGHG